MSLRHPIEIFDGRTRQVVSVYLLEELNEAEVAEADREWQPFLHMAMVDALARGVDRMDLPEHAHWEWRGKYQSRPALSRFFGIESDGQMQAMMAVRMDKRCRLTTQRGMPLVYVDYLAAAPWNLTDLVEQPRYRNCGTALITAAIACSESMGWEGRIGLHSLPQAESYYRDIWKLSDLGIDRDYEGLCYFERSVLPIGGADNGKERVGEN